MEDVAVLSPVYKRRPLGNWRSMTYNQGQKFNKQRLLFGHEVSNVLPRNADIFSSVKWPSTLPSLLTLFKKLRRGGEGWEFDRS